MRELLRENKKTVDSSSFSAEVHDDGNIDLIRPMDEDINEFLKQGRLSFPNIALSTATDRKETQMILLTADETYFLAHLGFLTVDQLSSRQLYQHFNRRQCCFAYFFAAYYHYRTRGWVLRPGHTFGCHFLLYKDGPAFNHSSFGVFVTVSSQNKTKHGAPTCSFCNVSNGGGLSRANKSSCSLGFELTVSQVCALSRSLSSSKKELILCNVNARQEICVDNFDSRNFEIDEQKITRWIPGNTV